MCDSYLEIAQILRTHVSYILEPLFGGKDSGDWLFARLGVRGLREVAVVHVLYCSFGVFTRILQVIFQPGESRLQLVVLTVNLWIP